MENLEKSEETGKLLSDIISDEEIELFYKLLPKIQEANFFLESLNNPEEAKIEDNSDKPSPYIVELDANCIVSKKGNSALSGPEIVHHENKKFYIDFIVSDYKAFIDTFYVNLQESLTKTCKDLYSKNKNDEQSKTTQDQ